VPVVTAHRHADVGQRHVLLGLDAHRHVAILMSIEVVHMQAWPADGLLQRRAPVRERGEHLGESRRDAVRAGAADG
jgi:hypothetical protein